MWHTKASITSGWDFIAWLDLQISKRTDATAAAREALLDNCRDIYYSQSFPEIRHDGYRGIIVEWSVPFEDWRMEIDSKGKVISYIQQR